jgi:hypothetical protein
LVVGSVQAFDKRIFIGAVRRTNLGLDTETEQEPDEWGRKVAARGSANEARIAVKRDVMRAAVGLQKAEHCFQNGLGMEISAHLGIEENGRTRVDKIKNFNHMLLLACRIGGDT